MFGSIQTILKLIWFLAEWFEEISPWYNWSPKNRNNEKGAMNIMCWVALGCYWLQHPLKHTEPFMSTHEDNFSMISAPELVLIFILQTQSCLSTTYISLFVLATGRPRLKFWSPFTNESDFYSSVPSSSFGFTLSPSYFFSPPSCTFESELEFSLLKKIYGIKHNVFT